MQINEIQLLSEDDFLPTMKNENRIWREKNVTDGYFESFDGSKLHYIKTVPNNPKACIVIVHGFCEFFGKYHEFIWYLYQLGFAVYMHEQRGHGYSEGKLPEHDLVHIDSYKTYVEDLHTFLKKIVNPETTNLKKILFAHSMGGAVSGIFLVKYPDFFSAAVMSSPMFKMLAMKKYNNMQKSLLKFYVRLFRKSKKIGAGQHHFTGIPDYKNSSTRSEVRFNYLYEQRIEDKHYQTAGATFGWAIASIDATKWLSENANKITIPIDIMTAGQDTLVDADGFKEFKENVPQAVFHNYPDSRHEIFNASDSTRKKYYMDLFKILESY
ncbi:MAG: lysophospholipase [Butyrivibrio sp.]|nr:lysophospholipase [Butyrivibrio sp.]